MSTADIGTGTASSEQRRPSLGNDFWRMWASAGLSSLADGIIKVALPLVAVSFTRSPALVAGLSFAFNLPFLLCALPVGALVDRLDRRHAMLGADIFRALMFAGLVIAVLSDAGSIWVLYGVAFCVSVAQTVYETSAQSIMPQLVEPDLLPRANGRMYAAQLTASEFVGPPLAGLLAGLSVVLTSGTPLALWLVAVGVLLLARGSFYPPRDRHTTIRAEIAEGLRFLWRQRLLRVFTVMVGVFNFANHAVSAVFVLYAVGQLSPMKLSGQAFGLLLSTMAVGSVAGSLAARQVERQLGRTRSLALSFFAGALLIGIPAVTTNAYVIGIVFFAGGAGVMISNIIMVSLRQRVTPNRLLGRVYSSHRLVANGAQPLGAAIGGLLAQAFGVRAVFAIMGLLALAVLIGLTTITDDVMDAAERETATTESDG